MTYDYRKGCGELKTKHATQIRIGIDHARVFSEVYFESLYTRYPNALSRGLKFDEYISHYEDIIIKGTYPALVRKAFYRRVCNLYSRATKKRDM